MIFGWHRKGRESCIPKKACEEDGEVGKRWQRKSGVYFREIEGDQPQESQEGQGPGKIIGHQSHALKMRDIERMNS